MLLLDTPVCALVRLMFSENCALFWSAVFACSLSSKRIINTSIYLLSTFTDLDLVERAVREIGDPDPMGRDAEPGLEPGFRPVPSRAHDGGFRAAGRGGLYAAGHRGRSSPAGEAGDHAEERSDEVAGQVQNGVEQVLHCGAAQNPAAFGARDVEQEHRGKRSPGRAAAPARVAQGTSLIV